MSGNEFILLENEHFRIEHAIYYRIAGFLFVIPQTPVHSISEMSMPALQALGPTIKGAVNAVEEFVKPINIYVAKFGESDGSVHFHIFPRTYELTQHYQSETNQSSEIDGPRLMSWANNYFLGDTEHGNISQTVKSLKEYFRNDT